MINIAVLSTDIRYQQRSICLAQKLQLSLVSVPDAQYTHYLEYQQERLQLCPAPPKTRTSLVVDFSQGSLNFRLRHTLLARELLIRATGLTSTLSQQRTVLDATAGLGRDTFLLALAGAQVTAIECVPVVAALFEDGLHRAQADTTLGLIAQRITFHQADTIAWLRQTLQLFDIIYLDPLFPPRHKTALVKKEMQYLQLIGKETMNTETLFAVARACARERIVVKRPLRAEYFNGEKPTYTLLGQSIRFDIYKQ